MIGTTFSHYRIVEKLGMGGMGEVYLAEDTELGRRVAIKFVPAQYATSAAAVERFKREARAAAGLNHPNIITVHDVGTHQGLPYIVMEHVDGELLTRAIERKDLTIDKALDIASQLMEGLSAAHEAGVIHRDVKPDNILIDRNGSVRILDFGLAKLRGSASLTTEHVTLGTARYMSPEQTRSAEVDARSDLFSAGIVLYEMLAGTPPFGGDHREAVLYAITSQDPQPLRRYNNRVGDGIERVVQALLAKDPEERYPSARAVLVDLRRERGLTSARIAAGGRASRRWIWTGVVGAACVFLAAAWWVAGKRTPVRLAAEGRSIAVLPLVNMSGDDSQEYFSDGLSEELTNALVKIPDLKVAGRTSAFSFKGRNEDLRAIGEELGVEHLLEGSVRKSGDTVRITVQLVKAADGFRVWGRSYDRTLDDIFAVQDDIARSVARELRVTLLSNGAAAPKPSAAAYDLVLQARFVLQNPTPETIRRAHEIMERALTLAPDYAPAWAEMGLLHFREYEVAGTHGERQRANEEAREALSRALAVDPDLATAHARMATVHRRDWNFRDAQTSIDRALALEPGNPIVIGSAAFLYYSLGRGDEAIALYQQLQRVDPLQLIGYWFLAESYVVSGRLDDAMVPLRVVQERAPDYWQAYITLGNIQLLRGDAGQARAAFTRLHELHPEGGEDALFYRAMVGHTAGDATASAADAAEFERLRGQKDPLRCAEIRGWRGEVDAAFAWLDRAFAAHDPLLHAIKTDIYLRPLHGDPRWDALLEAVGLPAD